MGTGSTLNGKIENIYSLTPMQEGMLFYDEMEKDSTNYILQSVYRVNENAKEDLIRQSVKLLSKRYEACRMMVISKKTTKPLLVVLKDREIEYQSYDFSDCQEEEWKEKLENLKKSDVKRGFHLQKDPLMRVSYVQLSGNQKVMIWCMHHIIIDGWCNAIILGSFMKYYESLLKGKSFEQLEQEIKWECDIEPKYGEYSKWIESQDSQKALSFFGDALEGFEGVSTVPSLKKPQACDEQVAKAGIQIPMSIMEEIQMGMGDDYVTVSTIVQAAWGLLLQSYNHTRDVVFGRVVSGRSVPIRDIDNMVGLFINTLPLRVQCEEGTTLRELLSQIQKHCNEASEYEYCSLAEIANLTKLGSNLFQTLLAYENYYVDVKALNSSTNAEQPLLMPEAVREQTNYPITVSANAGNDFLNLSIMYNPNEYCESQILNILHFAESILLQMQKGLDTKTSKLKLATQAEREQILTAFNNTAVEYEDYIPSFAEILKKRAAMMPDKTALITPEATMGYQEFDKRTSQLAAILQDKGVLSGDYVAILARRSMEMIIAIYGVIKAGAVYVPIDPEYPKERTAYILNDCRPKAVLTAFGKESYPHQEVLDGITVLDVENIDWKESIREPEEVAQNSERIIYAIYTSGTTGKPKGVANYERGLLNTIYWLQHQYPITSEDVILQKTSYCFDVSASEILWFPLAGASLVLPEPGAEKDTVKISQVIREHNVTVVNFVPSMLQLFLATMKHNRVLAENIKGLRYVIAAGEALGEDSVQLLYELSDEIGSDMKVINAYGPTEASIYSTYYNCEPDSAKVLIGKPVANAQIYIFANDDLAGVGIPGELCIAGAGVAKGYIHLEELTKEKFTNNPYKEGTLYRSGDLARWLPDGNIEYLGRMDQQVKIRGFRIELGEIESIIRKQAEVKNCAVIAKRDKTGDLNICAYLESDSKLDIAKITRQLEREVPAYMIPAYILQIDEIPLNQSGKLNRRALPDPEAVSSKEYLAPRTELEATLCEIFAAILGEERIGVHDDFFEMGGHSLRATRLVNQIEAKIGCRVELQSVFIDRTVERIAKRITGEETVYEPIPVVSGREFYKMSSVQKRMFLISQMDSDGILYNMPQGIELTGSVDKDAIKAAFEQMIERHEILRTAFIMKDGEPIQHVLAHCEADFVYEEDTTRTKEELLSRFVKPFHLESGSLIRVKLVKCQSHYLLMFDMHHIISDGMSCNIFIKEFMALYNHKTLDTELRQYKDYSEWMANRDLSEQKNYWLDIYKEKPPVLEMPLDYPRQNERSYHGAMVHAASGEKLYQAVKTYGKKTGTTDYMILLSGVMALLAMYSGQEDIVVGTPVSGRTHPDTEQMLGMFVNTLALRGKPTREKSFESFLMEMKETCLKAFANQEYPFEELISHIEVNDDMCRNPLFDVMFVLQNTENAGFVLEGSTVTGAVTESTVAKFDMTFHVAEANGEFYFDLEYCTDIYKENSMQWMLTHYLHLLEQALDNTDNKLADYEMATMQERETILNTFQNIVEFGECQTVTEQFLAQVKKTPDNIAVIYHEENITYQELARRAALIARKLEGLEIQREDRVALYMERSVEMVAAILGVYMANAAYVPLGVDYPEERIRFMLEDSEAKAVITYTTQSKAAFLSNQTKLFETLPCLNLNEEEWQGEAELVSGSRPEDLAYIIYTSGSTGKPKGVMIEQSGPANLMHYQRTALPVTEDDRILMFSNYVFDGSVWEMMMPLAFGAALVMADEDIIREPEKMKAYIKQTGASISSLPPAYYRQSGVQFDKLVITAGSASSKDIVEKAIQKGVYLNSYGPTEVTVCATDWKCEKGDSIPDVIPIGRPVTNQQVVIKKDGKLCGYYVPGEICVGGKGVARGYLNQPELTDEKFVIDSNVMSRVYHTGDLGRWLPDGNIEYLGRNDEQVKIRGYRIEIQEILQVLLGIPEITDGVIMVRESEDGNQYICAYYVADIPIDKSAVRAELAKALPSYMIPSKFLQMDQIPVTVNGKPDKKALPVQMEDFQEEYVAPESDAEIAVCEAFEAALGIDKVGMKTSFFEAGGDSIKAMLVVSRLREAGYEVTVKTVLQGRLPELIVHAMTKLSEQDADYETVTGEVKNTPVIEEFLNDWNLSNPAHFNQAMTFPVEGANMKLVQDALEAVVEHHDMLRSVLKDGKLVIQPYKRGTSFTLEEADGTGEHDYELWAQDICTRVQESIDLAEGPLVKAVLFHGDKDYLFVCMHHLVIDGVSLRIFGENFSRAYEQIKATGKAVLPGKTMSFKAWSEMLSEYPVRYMEDTELSYWSKVVSNIQNLSLNIEDAKENLKQTEQIAVFTKSLSLSEEQTEDFLRRTNHAFGTEHNDVLLAALASTVQKLTGQEHVSVMLESHGRVPLEKKVNVDRTIGWFTCSYPVNLSCKKSTKQNIIFAKEAIRDIPNGGIGYGMLPKDSKKNVDIYFNYLGEMVRDTDSIYPLGESVAKENALPGAIKFNGFVVNKQLQFSIQGDSRILTEEQLQNLARLYKESLCEIIQYSASLSESERTKSDYSSVTMKNEDLQYIRSQYPDVEDIYTLSPLQKGMMFHNIQSGSGTEYVLQTVYTWNGILHKDILRQATELLAWQYQVLRTAFVDYRFVSTPLQVVLKDRKIEWNEHDFTALDEQSQDENMKKLVREDVERGFDLIDDALMRMDVIQYAQGKYDLIVTAHHIIMDGWSSSAIIGNLISLYMKLEKGISYDELKQEITAKNQNQSQYSDYINWIEKRSKKTAMSYWEQLLEGYEESAAITPVRKPEKQSSNMIRADYEVSTELTEKLRQTAAGCNVTINTITETVWGILLQKYNHINDVVFGKVVSGRNAEIRNIEEMTGLFINTIPVRETVTEETKVSDLLLAMQNQSNESGNYDYCALADIQSASGIGENLVKTLYVYENYYIDTNVVSRDDAANMEFTLGMKQVREQTNYALTVSVNITLDTMHWNIMYNPNEYAEEEIHAIYRRIQLMLEQIARNPDMLVQELEFALEEEREQILGQFNHEPVPYEENVAKLWNEQAKMMPDKTAVIYGKQKLTYEELDAHANQIAKVLAKYGICKGESVAFLADPDVETIAWILGIVKHGCSYVAIDSSYPKSRMQFMLKDSNTRMLFTAKDIELDVAFKLNPSMEVQGDDITDYEEQAITKDDLIYLIYTSGTTGEPKASMIEHKSVVRLVKDKQCYQMNEDTVLLQSGTMAFDAFTLEMWGPLLCGGTLILSDKEMLLQTAALAECITNNNVNTMWLTARLYNQIVMEDVHVFDTLTYLMIGGEKLSEDHVRRLKSVNTHTKLINGYGPTENTTFTTVYTIPDTFTEIPIGKPVQNTQVYIMNHKALCGIGMVGELCTAGDGVARGYLNQKELTAQRFITNPYGKGLLYRTGDMAKWTPDGNVLYCQRADEQVKLRGYRIELGEIETALRKLDEVTDAVVVFGENEAGQTHLYAYLVNAEERLDIMTIRQKLIPLLPTYMIPTYMMQIEAIPISPNGKLDKKVLPKIMNICRAEYAAPRNENEQHLCKIYGEAVGIDRFGIDDNLFELGANSLTVMQIVGRSVSEGFQITIQNVFEHPTIRELVEYKDKNHSYEELITKEEDIQIRKLLKGNVLENDSPITERKLGKVFLTGGTGFMGAHIISKLLEAEAEMVYCLVRCRGEEHGYERMKENLHYYFGEAYDDEFSKRIIVIPGDLITSDYEKILPDDIDTIIHTAAHTKHYGFYEEFYNINVVATQKIANYAKAKGISLTYISTMSICAIIDAEETDTSFTEKDFYKKQVLTDSPYALTKFLAEKAVLQAMRDGLDAIILRVGNLTNRYSDLKGAIDYRNNRFISQMKTLLKTGNFSEEVLHSTLEFSPIDEVAEGVVSLTRFRAEGCNTFHLHSDEYVSFSRFIQAIEKAGVTIKNEVNLTRYLNNNTEEKMRNEIYSFLAALSYERTVQGVCSENAFTLSYLDRIGFKFKTLNDTYIDSWVKYYKELGYWNE